jgi:hypothetical protein
MLIKYDNYLINETHLIGLSLPEELVFKTTPKRLGDIYSEDIIQSLTRSFIDWKSHHKLSSGYFSIKIDEKVKVSKSF